MGTMAILVMGTDLGAGSQGIVRATWGPVVPLAMIVSHKFVELMGHAVVECIAWR